MRKITLTHKELRTQAKFTDPICKYDLCFEQEILGYQARGDLHPPVLMPNGDCYLIFNGNHRVLAAINNKLTIECLVLEDINDVMHVQREEMDNRLLLLTKLTFEGIVTELEKAAKKWAGQNPDNWLE